MTETTLNALARITRRIPNMVEQRDQLIHAAKAEGVTVTKIAATSGLSRSQVHRILANDWNEGS